MKSSKLIDIFKQGNMVIPLYLLQHYKDFKLKLEEFIFLMYLYNLGDNFIFDPSKFSGDLNITLTEAMKYVEILTDKHFIKVESKKNEKGVMEEFVIMDDFYNKLSMITIDEVNKQTEEKDYSIFEVIESEFGRTISPIEIEIIKAWVDSGVHQDVIREAVKEATFNGVSNLRYIDKIIYEWGKNGIKTVKDVEEHRQKRNATIKKDEAPSDVDMDVIEWNWFDDDE